MAGRGGSGGGRRRNRSSNRSTQGQQAQHDAEMGNLPNRHGIAGRSTPVLRRNHSNGPAAEPRARQTASQSTGQRPNGQHSSRNSPPPPDSRPDRAGGQWTPPPNWQGPATPRRGTWEGDVGNSRFALSDAQCDHMGLPRGTRVQFNEGVPDFTPWAVDGPNGRPPAGNFTVPGLQYEHRHDRNAAIAVIAEQNEMSKAAVRRWLAAENIRIHHYQGDQMQLVPSSTHDNVHHTGSRSMRR